MKTQPTFHVDPYLLKDELALNLRALECLAASALCSSASLDTCISGLGNLGCYLSNNLVDLSNVLLHFNRVPAVGIMEPLVDVD